MRPEKKGEREEEKGREGDKQQSVDLNDEEKIVFDLLKDNSPLDLNSLKAQTGLSNKKWDKAIKSLTKKELAKVEKTEAGQFTSAFTLNKLLKSRVNKITANLKVRQAFSTFLRLGLSFCLLSGS
ncbi:MAG: hypothetical protein V2I37_04345 [Marinilabiliaceae bacterium]|jgi:hypothetical protein|nr:hypothetical protein [Marinilabiliaceae bacterium]